MGRRQGYNNLRAALNYLRPLAGGTTSAEAPSDTALRRYQEYRAGRTRRTITRAATSRPGIKTDYTIQLFGEDAGNDSAIALVGARAIAGLNEVSLELPVLGLTARAAGADPPDFSGNFSPAKVVCFRATGTGTERPSGVTGLRYKPRTGASYTYPFGKVSGTDRFRDRAAAIDAATGANVTCTFLPEDIIDVI